MFNIFKNKAAVARNEELENQNQELEKTAEELRAQVAELQNAEPEVIVETVEVEVDVIKTPVTILYLEATSNPLQEDSYKNLVARKATIRQMYKECMDGKDLTNVKTVTFTTKGVETSYTLDDLLPAEQPDQIMATVTGGRLA